MKTLPLFLALVLQIPAFGDVRMLYIAQAGYQPRDIQVRAEEYKRQYGTEVKLTFAQYEEVYDLVHASASQGTPDFDVVLADLIWMDDYVSRGILLPCPDTLAASISDGIVPEISRPFRKDGRYWAFPFLANHQLLYLNMDLLSRAGFTHPPSTLEEMMEMARAARAKGVMKYPLVESWDKAESLICDFTVFVGAFGGDLMDSEGRPRVDSPECVQALAFMRRLLAEELVNPVSLQSDEVFAADAFLKGDAMMQTNWTFVTGRINEDLSGKRDQFVAALIPVAAAVRPAIRTSTVSGFQGLAVLKNASDPVEAWRFVRFLASPDFQREHLSEMSVWKEVWAEARTRQIDPYIGLKMAQLAGVHYRFAHPAYRRMSLVLQDAISRCLHGQMSPTAALQEAQRELEQME